EGATQNAGAAAAVGERDVGADSAVTQNAVVSAGAGARVADAVAGDRAIAQEAGVNAGAMAGVVADRDTIPDSLIGRSAPNTAAVDGVAIGQSEPGEHRVAGQVNAAHRLQAIDESSGGAVDT